MKKLIPTLVSSALVLGLVGCADGYYNNGYYGPGAAVGTVGGAVAGGVAGGAIGSAVGNTGGAVVGAVGGTLLGAFLGYQVGSSFDQPTVVAIDQSGAYAFDYGRPRYWRTATCYGQVIPSTVYYTPARVMCRPFTAKVRMHNGVRKIVHGTACKNARGQWVVTR